MKKALFLLFVIAVLLWLTPPLSRVTGYDVVWDGGVWMAIPQH